MNRVAYPADGGGPLLYQEAKIGSLNTDCALILSKNDSTLYFMYAILYSAPVRIGW